MYPSKNHRGDKRPASPPAVPSAPTQSTPDAGATPVPPAHSAPSSLDQPSASHSLGGALAPTTTSPSPASIHTNNTAPTTVSSTAVVPSPAVAGVGQLSLPAPGPTSASPAPRPAGQHGAFGIGAHVARATRVDAKTSERRDVVVRLGCTLFWTFADRRGHEIPAGASLESWREHDKWRNVGAIHRKEIELSRNAVLEYAPPSAAGSASSALSSACHVVRLLTQTRDDLLTLDFGHDGAQAINWCIALRLMTRPWEDIIVETKDNLPGRLLSSGIIRLPSSSVATGAGEAGQNLQVVQASDFLQRVQQEVQATNETLTPVAEFIQTVADGLGVAQPVLTDVLGQLPVVGAGFQIVALCLSAVSRLCCTIADEQYAASLSREVNFIGRHAVTEMMYTANMSREDGELFLGQLTSVMAVVERASADLDWYLINNTAANVARGLKLGTSLEQLKSIREKLIVLRGYRTTIETKGKTLEPHARLEGMEDSITKDVAKLGVGQGKCVDDKDAFTPTFSIPRNPNGVYLNFSLDARGNPKSTEGQLKAAVIRCDAERSKIVAAVGASQQGRLLGATGMGGVGKTCALLGVGHEVDVPARYTGGVYFLSLGKDVTARGIVRQVADLVESSGGMSKASEMRLRTTIGDAMRIAAFWFARRRCLFVCDDLWNTLDKRTGFFGDLYKLVERGDGSCILFSTRDSVIGSNASTDPVVFKNREPQSPEAKEILSGHAKMKKKDLRDMDENGRRDLEYVLGECAGLPVALAVAGRAIAGLLRTPGRAPTAAVSAYKRGLCAVRDRLVAHGVDLDSVQYPSLRQVVEASATAAEARKPRGSIFSIRDMHSALCVIQKQQWVPVTMLARLWGFETEDEAENVANLMSDFSIVETECRGNILGVKLHDLIHDICAARADENGGMSLWHRRLIDGYATRLLGATAHAREDSAAGTRAPWWSSELTDDGYIHSNIARHLAGCGEGGRRELIALLLDFRWVKLQLGVCGILTVRSDYDLLQSTTTSATAPDTDVDEDLSSSLVLIAGAVQLAWGYAHANHQELAFQLHGRLFSRRAEFTAVETFVASVERHAERPWLRSLDPFFGATWWTAYSIPQP